jgi:hypothetical protein
MEAWGPRNKDQYSPLELLRVAGVMFQRDESVAAPESRLTFMARTE